MARMDACILALPERVWDLSVHGCGIVPSVGEDFASFARVYSHVFGHLERAEAARPECWRRGDDVYVSPATRKELRDDVYVSLRDGNGDEENMATRPECWQTNEKVTGIGTEALKTHLQKKMVGWILRFIWESLDFLKLWCRPNEKGQFTTDIKQGAWEINNKLAILSAASLVDWRELNA